jgi:hypothetical protein
VSGDVDRLNAAAEWQEKRAIVDALVPEYTGTYDSDFGRVVVYKMPEYVGAGWSDAEIMDKLRRWRYLGHAPTLRELNASEALLAALRPQPDPEVMRSVGLSRGRARQTAEAAKKRTTVRTYADSGLSQNATAMKTGYSRRTVQRYWPR